MLESAYQAKLIKQLLKMFPGCVILKNDPSYMQGIPDLIILFNDKWAMLEVKASANAAVQPNQEYYIQRFKLMSFGSFIYPENEKEVLDALQSTFATRGPTRLSECEQLPLGELPRREIGREIPIGNGSRRRNKKTQTSVRSHQRESKAS